MEASIDIELCAVYWHSFAIKGVYSIIINITGQKCAKHMAYLK
jgi:hypothetical protein